MKCLNCILDLSQLWPARCVVIVHVCVSALADNPLEPEGESLNKDMMDSVREVDWVSIAPSVALLVGVLDTVLLFPT